MVQLECEGAKVHLKHMDGSNVQPQALRDGHFSFDDVFFVAEKSEVRPINSKQVDFLFCLGNCQILCESLRKS
jgi:hypothetical protein